MKGFITGKPQPAIRYRGRMVALAIWTLVGFFCGGGATAWSQVNWSGKLIEVSPVSRRGLFSASDAITISTSNNAAITLSRLHDGTVYQGPPTTFHLAAGHYFVATATDRTQFAVLPNNYAGGHLIGSESVTESNSFPHQRLNRINPSWIRLLHEGNAWVEVQPTPTTWNWSRMDAAINASYQPNRKIIVCAWYRPTWVTNDAQFMPAYKEYLRQMCLRYGSKIYAIEIWNEASSRVWWPNHPEFWIPHENSHAELVPAYIHLLTNAVATIKSVNPAIKVYGAAWSTPDVQFYIEDFAARGGQLHLDGFTVHDYNMRRAPPDALTELPDGTRDRIDRILARYRELIGDKEVLMDEGGLYGRSTFGIPTLQTNLNPSAAGSDLTWERGMHRAIKYMVLYAAGGAKAVIPHTLPSSASTTNANYEVYGWELDDRGPHPKTSAYLMSGHWLNNAQFVASRTPATNASLYAWRRSDNSSLVFAWAAEGKSLPFNSSGLTITDLFGSPTSPTSLTERPLLISSTQLDPTNLLATVRSRIQTTNNLPPDFDPLPTLSVIRGQVLTFRLTAQDHDGDPISFAATQLPTGATFNSANATFTWPTTTATATGLHQAAFSVTDTLGGTRSLTVTITVLNALTDGLIHHWPLNHTTGTLATNIIASNHGTLTQFNFTPTSGWSTGKLNNALQFDGQNDFVQLDSGPLYHTNNFSLSLWFNLRNVTGNSGLLSLRSTYLASGLRVGFDQQTLFVQGQTTAGWKALQVTPTTLSSNRWYHLAVIYDNATVRTYLDGQLLATAPWGHPLIMNPTSSSWLGLAAGNHLAGALDEVQIYSRPLTESQVLTLYTEQSGANRAPTITSPGNKSVNENANLSFTVSGSDPDGDALTYSASGLPPGATFNTSTRTFSWTPSFTQAGSYNVTFTVSDGSLSASATITITVVNVNRAPTIASPGNKSVNENTNLSFTVSGSDPDGDALTYSASGLPPGATFNTSTRTFSWTPSFTQAGSYNVTFTVSDGSLSASATITITVANVNRAPTIASPGNKSVNENTNLSFTVSGSDPDGDALTYSASGLPPGATFNTSTRTFSWTPSFTQAGSYNVTFTVSDGSLSASATITITVANVNRAPTLTSPGNKTIGAGSPLAFTVTGSDPDNDPLTYSTGALPNGAAFNTSTRQFAWTPTALQVGAHNVTFGISDGSLTAFATITITVTNSAGTTTNSVPVLADPDALNTAATFELTATLKAADADGETVSFSASGLPTGATLSTNGVFRWTPTLTQTGVFVPSIVLSDGRASTAVRLPVFVTHPNYDWLAGAKLFAYRHINDRIFVYSFRRLDRTSIVFAWTASGFSYPLRAVEGLQQVTLTGGTSNFTTLGANPVLFLSDERISPRQALDRVVAAIQY